MTWKPDSVFQMSLHECWALTITPLKPLPLVLLMQPGMGLTFIAMRACCWFMSHLLSIRTSASFLALVVLASYSTISAKGWGGFVPDIGPWCFPWLYFVKFLLCFSSLSFFWMAALTPIYQALHQFALCVFCSADGWRWHVCWSW